MRKLRQIRATRRRDASDFLSDKWIEDEAVGCQFQDARHGRRLRQLLEQLSGRVGAMTPWASQDWANTKAAYRFFGNDQISEANILAGHFASTRRGSLPGAAFRSLFFTTQQSFHSSVKTDELWEFCKS
jgi:Transposase DNA-binding